MTINELRDEILWADNIGDNVYLESDVEKFIQSQLTGHNKEAEVMSPEKLIRAVANLWVANEGTARGLDWCLPNLKDAVNELIKKQEEEK